MRLPSAPLVLFTLTLSTLFISASYAAQERDTPAALNPTTPESVAASSVASLGSKLFNRKHKNDGLLRPMFLLPGAMGTALTLHAKSNPCRRGIDGLALATPNGQPLHDPLGDQLRDSNTQLAVEPETGVPDGTNGGVPAMDVDGRREALLEVEVGEDGGDKLVVRPETDGEGRWQDPDLLEPTTRAMMVAWNDKDSVKQYHAWASPNQCFIDTLKLKVNPETQNNEPNPKYDVRLRGGTESFPAIENLLRGPLSWFAGAYYSKVVKELEKEGYEKDKTLFAVPFDWRYATYSSRNAAAFVSLLRRLHQSTVDTGLAAVVVAHSMGNLFWLSFCNAVEKGALNAEMANLHIVHDTKEHRLRWLKDHVKTYVSIAAPFAGSPATYVHMFSGSDMLSLIGVSRGKLRGLAHSLSSLYSLAPASTDAEFWSQDPAASNGGPGVKVGDSFYGIDQIPEGLVKHTGADEEVRKFVESNIKRPRVGLTPSEALTTGLFTSVVYYGDTTPEELNTPFRVKYTGTGDLSKQEPEFDATNGDGTVPTSSVLAAKKWKKPDGSVVESHDWDGRDFSKLHENAFNFRRLDDCRRKPFLRPVNWKRCDHFDMMIKNERLIEEIFLHGKVERNTREVSRQIAYSAGYAAHNAKRGFQVGKDWVTEKATAIGSAIRDKLNANPAGDNTNQQATDEDTTDQQAADESNTNQQAAEDNQAQDTVEANVAENSQDVASDV